MTNSAHDALMRTVHIDDIETVDVCPGITRRRLTASDFARGWLIDFAPGSEWPEVDHHQAEERYFVLSGEVIDNGQRHPAGTYVVFAPGSSHRPRTDHGARIIGLSDIRG